MTIYSSTNIENSGSFKATDVTLFSGADLTYTGHYGTASATTVAASGFNVNNMTCKKGCSWTINGNDAIINAQSLTFEQGASLTINADVSAENQSTPIIGGQIDKLTMLGDVTLNFNAVDNLQAGSYTILNAADEEWTPENITLTGVDAELKWVGNALVLTIGNQVIVQIDPLADAVQAANWGVYKSSQAFTGILWAPHSNAVSLTPVDEKAPRPTGQSVAWASAYSQFSEIGGSHGFRNYDYSIYGGAVGVEHRFSSGHIKADSLQNLRLMMGAGVSHNIGRTTVFGELAIHNDTMRHNPSVEIDGFRYGSGSNPGRLGGSISVGAEYSLNDDWSLRGNYSFEGADDHTQHSINAGAVYSF